MTFSTRQSDETIIKLVLGATQPSCLTRTSLVMRRGKLHLISLGQKTPTDLHIDDWLGSE